MERPEVIRKTARDLRVAPGALEPARPLHRQVDRDSMGWLNFPVGLHERLGINIPKAHDVQHVTLDKVLDDLLARLGPAGA